MKRNHLPLFVLAASLLVLAACGKTEVAKPEAKAPPPAKTKDLVPLPPATGQGSITPVSAETPRETLSLTVYRKTPQGAMIVADPNFPFRNGDSIRVMVKAPQTGYLYILNKGTSGRTRTLFPSPRLAGGKNLLEANQETVIPAEGWIRFSGRPGVEKLYVVFATDQSQVLFQEAGQLAGGSSSPAPTPETEAEVLQTLQTRSKDMILTTESSAPAPVSAGPRPEAVGAGQPAPGQGPILVQGSGTIVAVLELRHE